MKAVVLLSGGMDSCTAMAQAREDGATELIAVSARYGSLHQDAESQAADNVAEYYKAEFVRIEMPKIFGGADSALMGDIAMPHLTYAEIDANQGPSPTVVPFRNANLLSIATTVAITHGASNVYAGMHGEDAHNWAYPDCTPEFLGAMANAIYVGSYHQVRLQFPLIWMSKAAVCRRALELEAPLDLTWSCYSPVDEKGIFTQCGQCPTCIERIEAFRANDTVDPVQYAIPVTWEGCFPFYRPWSK